jgi:hypothetical protein
MGRKTAWAVFLAAAPTPAICGHVYGGDRPLIQLPAYYHPVDLLGAEKAPDQRGGFKKMRKQVSKRSAAYLTRKMGKNYFTQKIAPLVLDSWTQVFVPRKSGEIGLRSPLWAVDKTASSFLAREKKHLSKWVDQVFPNLPLVGNIASDLLESQKLSFSSGLPRYRMRSKKRIAPTYYQWGDFSLSGGTETRFSGIDLKGLTLVTAFRYEGEDESYGVDLFGKVVNFKIDTNLLKAEVTWDPDGVEFEVELTFGQ